MIFVWGDFSYDGNYVRYNILSCKGENGYRILIKADVTCWDLGYDNKDMLLVI
jgi:hypothetical protein